MSNIDNLVIGAFDELVSEASKLVFLAKLLVNHEDSMRNPSPACSVVL